MEQLGAVTEVVMEDTEDLSAFIPPLGPGSQAESGGGWCWLGVHCLLGGILMGKWRCTGDGWTAMSTHGVGMMDTMSCCSQPLKIDSVPGYPAAMLIICGALVNGPYALITTAVSADLVRGEPQTPPRCPCTHRGCSLFPRGILLGFLHFTFVFQCLQSPVEKGRAVAGAALCTISYTGVFPVAFSPWPHDCVSALLHLPVSTDRMEIFGGRSPGNFCLLLGIHGLAAGSI